MCFLYKIFVQLRTLYPNMEMQVLLYASKTPLFSFSSGATDVHVPAAAKFSVVKPDGKLVPLFRLDVVSLCLDTQNNVKQKQTKEHSYSHSK